MIELAILVGIVGALALGWCLISVGNGNQVLKESEEIILDTDQFLVGVLPGHICTIYYDNVLSVKVDYTGKEIIATAIEGKATLNNKYCIIRR